MTLDDRIINQFAKDCAQNYEKGVEYSIRFIYGPLTQVVNVPRDISVMERTSTSRKRDYFKNLLFVFLEKAEVIGHKNNKSYCLKIQYLPLQGRDYENIVTTFDKSLE